MEVTSRDNAILQDSFLPEWLFYKIKGSYSSPDSCAFTILQKA